MAAILVGFFYIVLFGMNMVWNHLFPSWNMILIGLVFNSIILRMRGLFYWLILAMIGGLYDIWFPFLSLGTTVGFVIGCGLFYRQIFEKQRSSIRYCERWLACLMNIIYQVLMIICCPAMGSWRMVLLSTIVFVIIYDDFSKIVEMIANTGNLYLKYQKN